MCINIAIIGTLVYNYDLIIRAFLETAQYLALEKSQGRYKVLH